MTVKNFECIEEVLDLVEPKSICLLFEVKHGYDFNNPQDTMKAVDLMDFMLGRLEHWQDGKELDIKTYLVARRPIPEEHAQIIPVYYFIDPKADWAATKTSDLVFVKRIDEKHEIIRAPEEFEIPHGTRVS